MAGFQTEQEGFWAGEFGDAYVARNRGERLLAAKTALFGRALRGAAGLSSACELGCNIGLNLRALSALGVERLKGIEINPTAAAEARAAGIAEISERSILEDLADEGDYDLAFTMGVLIHIAPDRLPAVYDNLAARSRRYVMICEYYSPSPVSIPYRGHSDRLFKRDFAGELMDRHDLRLVDYGFAWRRDNLMPLDDLTWFLLQKP